MRRSASARSSAIRSEDMPAPGGRRRLGGRARRLAGLDAEERLPAALVALRAALLLRVLLGLLELVLGRLQPRLDVRAVELVGLDRLLDEDQRPVAVHLQVALALGERLVVVLRGVEAQLRRVEHR